MVDKIASLRVKAEVILTPQELSSALYQFVRNKLGIYPDVDLVLEQNEHINGVLADEDLVTLVKAAEYLSRV